MDREKLTRLLPAKHEEVIGFLVAGDSTFRINSFSINGFVPLPNTVHEQKLLPKQKREENIAFQKADYFPLVSRL